MEIGLSRSFLRWRTSVMLLMITEKRNHEYSFIVTSASALTVTARPASLVRVSQWRAT